jgi:methionyl-tRNA formyltransferase
MRYLFFGSGSFAGSVLRELHGKGLDPVLAVTVPDTPVGRRAVLTPPPLKVLAQEFGIPVEQFSSLKKDPRAPEIIASFHPEVGVVADYGRFFSRAILDLFPHGVLVVHPSLLPRWRGLMPVENTIYAGDSETGVTVIAMDEQMDHGPMVAQEKTALGNNEYTEDVYARLATMGGTLIARVMPDWVSGKLNAEPQNESHATVCTKFGWQSGNIDFSKTAREIYNLIRAVGREPGAWTAMQDKNGKELIVKILRADPAGTQKLFKTASLGIRQSNGAFALVCKDGILNLAMVQPEGKRPMTGKEFWNGYGKR